MAQRSYGVEGGFLAAVGLCDAAKGGASMWGTSCLNLVGSIFVFEK